jgi:hypothetical protein
MRNSNSPPPKYGAEGPPGGPEAWAQQRAQAQGGKPSGMQRMLGAVAGMNPQMLQQIQAQRAQQQAMSQPQPWSQVGRTQWGSQGAPQGGQVPQGAPPPQMPQQGMAGLGQAAGRGMQMLRAGALRRGAGRMQEQ